MLAKPILFSTPMVEAQRAGIKTMTRRPIALKYCNTHIQRSANAKYGHPLVEIQNDVEGETYWKLPNGGTRRRLLAMREVHPQYIKGDVLYVRETWRREGTLVQPYAYKADEKPLVLAGESGQVLCCRYRWHPSIHMPKEAARIFLCVTDVRPERLQEITETDAKAEGANFKDGKNVGVDEKMSRTAVERFREIWNEIYAAPKPQKENGRIVNYISYPWDDVYETREYKGLPWYVRGNPWVWAYTFRQTDKPQGWPAYGEAR
ncbi:MAG: hypothetical protein PHI27_06645 [Eubacteriales bacterium]|nr:hypothetical protein [Eubacteriales bacterium]MDD4513752.1 hypothetical protein [Eubacteriales bacterium]